MTDQAFYDSHSRSCPKESDLAAFVDGGLQAGDRDRLERHIADCDQCLGQISALAKLQDATLPEVDPALIRRAREVPPIRDRRRWTLTLQWAGACAATLCLATVITFWVRPARQVSSEAVRAGQMQAMAPEVLAPQEGASVARNAVEFRWTPISSALFYEVRVLNAEGDLVWQVRSESSAARPPDGLEFHPGQKYFVFVTASLPEGKPSKSAVVGFQVSGP